MQWSELKPYLDDPYLRNGGYGYPWLRGHMLPGVFGTLHGFKKWCPGVFAYPNDAKYPDYDGEDGEQSPTEVTYDPYDLTQWLVDRAESGDPWLDWDEYDGYLLKPEGVRWIKNFGGYDWIAENYYGPDDLDDTYALGLKEYWKKWDGADESRIPFYWLVAQDQFADYEDGEFDAVKDYVLHKRDADEPAGDYPSGRKAESLRGNAKYLCRGILKRKSKDGARTLEREVFLFRSGDAVVWLARRLDEVRMIVHRYNFSFVKVSKTFDFEWGFRKPGSRFSAYTYPTYPAGPEKTGPDWVYANGVVPRLGYIDDPLTTPNDLGDAGPLTFEQFGLKTNAQIAEDYPSQLSRWVGYTSPESPSVNFPATVDGLRRYALMYFWQNNSYRTYPGLSVVYWWNGGLYSTGVTTETQTISNIALMRGDETPPARGPVGTPTAERTYSFHPDATSDARDGYAGGSDIVGAALYWVSSSGSDPDPSFEDTAYQGRGSWATLYDSHLQLYRASGSNWEWESGRDLIIQDMVDNAPADHIRYAGDAGVIEYKVPQDVIDNGLTESNKALLPYWPNTFNDVIYMAPFEIIDVTRDVSEDEVTRLVVAEDQRMDDPKNVDPGWPGFVNRVMPRPEGYDFSRALEEGDADETEYRTLQIDNPVIPVDEHKNLFLSDDWKLTKGGES